jgi:hypothetical protein
MLWIAWKELCPLELQSFMTFKDILEKMFGDFDTELAVKRKLEKL